MRRNRVTRALTLAVIFALASSFYAQDALAGWFVGGSVGQSKTYDYSVGGPIDSSDEEDFAYRLGGGYTFIKYFGLAGSYVDLGDSHYEGPAFGGFTDTLSAKGFDFSALGVLPVHDRIGLIGVPSVPT